MSRLSEKAVMRAEILASRRAMAPAARSSSDAALVAALTTLVSGFGLVCAYAPMTGEPGGPGLLPALAGSRVLLPVLAPDRDLDWAEYSGPDALAAMGLLRQPIGPRLGPEAIRRADAVIVPAVAVDLSGNRLGRGGGSYDRALARVAPGVPVVAVLYDGELVERVPAEAHDRPVSAVITPSAGLRRLSD